MNILHAIRIDIASSFFPTVYTYLKMNIAPKMAIITLTVQPDAAYMNFSTTL